jgi:hypothetical protein
MLTGCAAESPRLQRAPPLARSASPEDLVGLWQGTVQGPMGVRQDWRVGIAVTQVVPDGEGRWRLVTVGSGLEKVLARQDAGRIVVDFEIQDPGRAKPYAFLLILNDQATKLDGWVHTASPYGNTSWDTLHLTLDRYVARPWNPTPLEVLPVAEARDLETTASVEAIAPRLVGTWTATVTSSRGSSTSSIVISSVRADSGQWRGEFVSPAGTLPFVLASVPADQGGVRLHAERLLFSSRLVRPSWLWVRRGGQELVGVQWWSWTDALVHVRLSRTGGPGPADSASETSDGGLPDRPPEGPGGR